MANYRLIAVIGYKGIVIEEMQSHLGEGFWWNNRVVLEDIMNIETWAEEGGWDWVYSRGKKRELEWLQFGKTTDGTLSKENMRSIQTNDSSLTLLYCIDPKSPLTPINIYRNDYRR